MKHFEGCGLLVRGVGSLRSVRPPPSSTQCSQSCTISRYIALVLLYANVKRSVWRPLIYHSASHTRVFPWATFTHHRSLFALYTHWCTVHYIIYRTTRFDTLACRLMFNTTANDRNETRTLHTERDPRLYTEPNTINSGKSLENQIYIHF